MSMTAYSHRIVLLLIAFSGILYSGSCSSATAYDPAREIAGDAAENFDYFANNWNVIGLKDYVHGSRITPDNQLRPGRQVAGADSHRTGPPAVEPGQPQAALHGWMPIIVVTADDGPVRYEITMWATPLPDVKDWHTGVRLADRRREFPELDPCSGHQHRRQAVSVRTWTSGPRPRRAAHSAGESE